MTCQTCGRPAENGRSTHWLGCDEALKSVKGKVAVVSTVDSCEHGDCLNPKRPQGKGPKPKYCDDHSDPKNRK